MGMNPLQRYLVIALIVMVVIAILDYRFTRNKAARRVHPLTGLTFALILAGLLFGGNLISFLFLLAGSITAVFDMRERWKHI